MVRQLVHGMGYRYRLHSPKLPGKPDLVLTRLKRIVEVRGCFWHQHEGCIDSHIPKTRRDYWRPKLKRNRQRDEENGRKVRKLGWRVLVLWECELSDIGRVSKRLTRFLGVVNERS
jgi:DNA mismatch endonuclease (patch repair protein)